ncbi:hypothetical protein ACHAXT_009342 [Thalassiosira profunda]
MDIVDARRQVAEINALLGQLKYSHAVEITTPALFGRLERAVGATNSNQTLPVKKCLSLSIKCRELDIDELAGLILAIDFPLDYPSSSSCSITAINDGEDAPSVNERIETYLRSFAGCECLELILDWLSDNRSTCLSCSSNNAESEDTAGKIKCYVLRFNHLLSGPEHKKEKAMMDAAKKMKLQGGLLWGTPGIVVVVPPSTEEDAREFVSESRDIGKRPDGVEAMHFPERGVEEAGLGGLAQQKRGGKLQSLDTAMLRTACGGDEDLLRSVLGVR